MELSSGRQSLNTKAFIFTMAVVYIQKLEFANLTDVFIGSLCLLTHLFYVMITHLISVTPLNRVVVLDLFSNDISINFLNIYKKSR